MGYIKCKKTGEKTREITVITLIFDHPNPIDDDVSRVLRPDLGTQLAVAVKGKRECEREDG